ncbi:MAG: MucBP domain-containing protein [Adlercreutzia sp.]|nr:MucBP domain-containing protein [Adlercreutzia sp.]
MRAVVKRNTQAALALAVSLLCAISLLGTPRVALAEGAEASSPDNAPAAEAIAVTGVDFMEPTAEGWELLKVQNGAGKNIYLDIQKNGAYLAQRMAYAIPEDKDIEQDRDTDYAGEGAKLAHIVALQMNENRAGDEGQTDTVALTPSDAFGVFAERDRYEITVHDAAREGQVLYEGTVYPVYAKLTASDGTESYELLGLRTQGKTLVDGALVDEPTRSNVGAGATYYTALDEGADRVAFELQPATAQDAEGQDGGAALDNTFVRGKGYFAVAYKQVASDAVSGAINYVDTEGNVVRSDSVSGITDEGVQATFEKSFFVKGKADAVGNTAPSKYYRVIKNLTGTTVTLTPTQPTYVVRVMEVAGADANAYEVVINYVDQNGKQLWSDEVDIKGLGYQYTLPNTFSMKQASGVNYYTLDRVQADRPQPESDDEPAAQAEGDNPWADANPVIKFDGSIADASYANSFGSENGKRVLTAVYQNQDVDKTVKLTIVEVDGSTNTEIGRVEKTVTPDEAAVYTPAAKTVEGVALVPWSGNQQEITYTWASLQEGVDLLQYVYYVPEDYVPGAAYDITVQYLNVANSQVLRTETLTVDPEITDFVEIIGEERFTAEGNEYVRLDGQETAIRHAYFSPTRTYTIYYRDVNDVLSSNITIQRTQIIDTERVVTVPGTTVVTAAPATTTVTEGAPAGAAPAGAVGAAGAAGGAGAAAPTTIDAGVGAGDGTAVIGDDATPLANNEGVTTGEERIADDANALASGVEPGSEMGAGTVAGIVLSLVALAALGTAAFLWLRWRKKKTATDSTIA